MKKIHLKNGFNIVCMLNIKYFYLSMTMNDILSNVDMTNFQKFEVNKIQVIYIYIDNGKVNVVKDFVELDDNELSKIKVKQLFNNNKIYNMKAYTLNNLIKYNFENNSLDSLCDENSFSDFTQYNKLDDIKYENTYFIDHPALYFILESKQSLNKTKKKNLKNNHSTLKNNKTI